MQHLNHSSLSHSPSLCQACAPVVFARVFVWALKKILRFFLANFLSRFKSFQLITQSTLLLLYLSLLILFLALFSFIYNKYSPFSFMILILRWTFPPYAYRYSARGASCLFRMVNICSYFYRISVFILVFILKSSSPYLHNQTVKRIFTSWMESERFVNRNFQQI